MRLSRIWWILQVEEGVIHQGRRPRWITSSEICRVLHILRKPNSIIALLFIQNIFFAQTYLLAAIFLLNKNNISSSPAFFGQRFNNLQRAAFLTSFWRHRFNNLTKFLSKFGEQQLVMVNYACGFNQSETGKYFEWIIINNHSPKAKRILVNIYRDVVEVNISRYSLSLRRIIVFV